MNLFRPSARCSLLVLLSAAVCCFAQETPPAQDLTISVDVEQVLLNISVQDRQGLAVPDLPQASFQVFEDGRRQAIESFSREDVPVTIGLVIDASRSMMPKYREVAAAALVFIRASNPKDEVFVVSFNEHSRLALPENTPFTSRPDLLEQALLQAPPDGQTALYDAIHLALEHIQSGHWDKQALIVVSDGGDNVSSFDFRHVFSHAERSDVIFYAIGLSDEFNEDRNPGVLKKFSRVTGGKAYFPERLGDVTQISEAIANDIRSQYTIAYKPTNQKRDGSFRRVRVTARSPEGRKLIVRTRQGYRAQPNR